MSRFVVRRIPGPGWQAGVPLRSQPNWPAHATFMNGLAEDRFVVLGGPIGSGNHALLVVEADTEAQIRERLAGDPWSEAKILTVSVIEPWAILLSSKT